MITLNNVMKSNAASCIFFGVLFMSSPSSVVGFLSLDRSAPVSLLFILGVVLFVNGLHIIWAVSKPSPNPLLVYYFSIGDFIWVILSIGLIALGIWINNPAGIVATLLVAVLVGVFGVLQIVNRPKNSVDTDR